MMERVLWRQLFRYRGLAPWMSGVVVSMIGTAPVITS